MKCKMFFPPHAVIVFLLVTLIIAGCGGALEYTKKSPTFDPSTMSPYSQEKIDLLVPPGYVEKTLPEGAYKQDSAMTKLLGSNPTVAFFIKKDSPDHIIVFCWSGLSFVSNTSLPDIARHLTESSMPDGKLTAGTYELGSGFFKKYFEAYSGNVVVEGSNLPAVNWLAWRGTAGLDCKYVVYGTTYGWANPSFEDEFVSLVKNLK